jgi:hypothetical protein
MIKYNFTGSMLYYYNDEGNYVFAKQMIKNLTEFNNFENSNILINNINHIRRIIKEIIKSDFKPFYGSIRSNGTITKNYPKPIKEINTPKIKNYLKYSFIFNYINEDRLRGLNKLQLIRSYRECININLKEAKDAIDAIFSKNDFMLLLNEIEYDCLMNHRDFKNLLRLKV